jgi:hypothetical protein
MNYAIVLSCNNIKRKVGDIYPFFPLQTIEPPLMVHRVAAILAIRFLGSISVFKYGLCIESQHPPTHGI